MSPKTYLGWWTNYTSYGLGFLALHGEPGSVEVGREPVTVEDLIDLSDEGSDEEMVLDLRGKAVYLGSCLTMGDQEAIRDFQQQSGARLVCGYTKPVNWLESAAFEMLLLSRFAATRTRSRRSSLSTSTTVDSSSILASRPFRDQPR